ncbi:hypothetical protein [Blastococcus saxobsidens]|nr:hypothetical protein [Blastococcus saxobsidens]
MKGKNYRGAQRGWLSSRRGMARAQVEVAHSMLVSAYFMLKNWRDVVHAGADAGETRETLR